MTVLHKRLPTPAALAAALALFAGCSTGPEIVERRDPDAEDLFVRAASFKVTMNPCVSGTVGAWVTVEEGKKNAVLSGLGVVFGLRGTGDRLENHQRAASILRQSAGDTKPPPEEGSLAAVMVSGAGTEGRCKPLGKGVSLDGGHLAMTYLRDRQGKVQSAAVGTVSKAEKGAWSVRAIPKSGGRSTLKLVPRYGWTDVGRAVYECLERADLPWAVRLEKDGGIVLVAAKPFTAREVMARIKGVRFYGVVRETRVLLHPGRKAMEIFGPCPKLERANIRMNRGGADTVRVVSGGRGNDFSVVEIRRQNRLLRVRTTRGLADIVRVLDRLGTSWAEVTGILTWAAGADALKAKVTVVEEEKE